VALALLVVNEVDPVEVKLVKPTRIEELEGEAVAYVTTGLPEAPVTVSVPELAPRLTFGTWLTMLSVIVIVFVNVVRVVAPLTNVPLCGVESVMLEDPESAVVLN